MRRSSAHAQLRIAGRFLKIVCGRGEDHRGCRAARWLAVGAVACLVSLIGLSGLARATGGVNTGQLFGVACPSIHQCTAIGEAAAITFDPRAPGVPVPVAIAPSPRIAPPFLTGIACPSVTRCIAVGWGGTEVTFNPRNPGTLTATQIAPGLFTGALSCPLRSQCTALNGVGEVTFDPNAPGKPATVDIGPSIGYASGRIVCPAPGQCTVLDENGREITFDPAAPGSPPAWTLDRKVPSSAATTGGALGSLACSSTRQCTAVGTREVTFDPVAPGAAPSVIATGAVAGGPIACPTVSQCTVLQDTPALGAFATATTFDPLIAPTPVAISIGTSFVRGLSCPSTRQCTTVDVQGREVTFDPTSQAQPTPVVIDRLGGALTGITSATASGTRAAVGVRCVGFYTYCSATLQLLVTERLLGRRIVAVGAAAAQRATRRPRLATVTVGVGRKTLTIPQGDGVTARIALNARGRSLLSRRHVLAVKLTMTQAGSPPVSQTIVFRSRGLHH
ncbi:MAG: hypothetical protein JWL67_302 [Solirubrobacterales bacterium]|nr:hypothetical protein [Solirubrobacterales bacterium]